MSSEDAAAAAARSDARRSRRRARRLTSLHEHGCILIRYNDTRGDQQRGTAPREGGARTNDNESAASLAFKKCKKMDRLIDRVPSRLLEFSGTHFSSQKFFVSQNHLWPNVLSRASHAPFSCERGLPFVNVRRARKQITNERSLLIE